MDAHELARHRARLEATRDALRAEGDLAIEPGRTDEAKAGVDDDAQPLVEMSQAIASGRNRTRTSQLHAILKALSRLGEEPEEFGNCAGCGEAIPARRLDLMPWAEFCIACKEAGEEGRTYGRKHIGDYR